MPVPKPSGQKNVYEGPSFSHGHRIGRWRCQLDTVVGLITGCSYAIGRVLEPTQLRPARPPCGHDGVRSAGTLDDYLKQSI